MAQAGDSFDLATLECSLLLGAGYNACVAVGYAPKHIASNDQSQQDCPYLAALGIPQRPAAPTKEGNDAEAVEGECAATGLPGRAGLSSAARRTDGLGRITEGEEANCSSRTPLGSRPATGAGPQAGTGSGGKGSGVKGEEAGLAGAGAEEACPATLETGGAGGLETAGTVQPDADIVPSAASCDVSATAASTAAEAGAQGVTAADAPEIGSGEMGSGPQQDTAGSTQQQQPPEPAGPERYLHAFVLVKPGGREVSYRALLCKCLCFFALMGRMALLAKRRSCWPGKRRESHFSKMPGAGLPAALC
jgi:hypothetical protein